MRTWGEVRIPVHMIERQVTVIVTVTRTADAVRLLALAFLSATQKQRDYIY